MKTPMKLSTVMASALLAIGLSMGGSAQAEGAATYTLGEGSMLHVFDDGSTLTFDPSGGYVYATPATEDAIQIAAVGSEALDEEGLAGRPGLDEEASFGTMNSTQGSRSSESEWQLPIPSATWESDNEE